MVEPSNPPNETVEYVDDPDLEQAHEEIERGEGFTDADEVHEQVLAMIRAIGKAVA